LLVLLSSFFSVSLPSATLARPLSLPSTLPTESFVAVIAVPFH